MSFVCDLQLEKECVKLVTELLTLPLETLGLRILELENYGAVMGYLGTLIMLKEDN